MSEAETTALQAEPLPPPRRRGRLWLVLIVLVAAGGFVAFRWLRSKEAAPVRYRTAPVTRGDVEQVVTATGTLSPRVTVTVGSQVSGRVQELFADYNSTVKKGQVIARIDSRLFRTEVDNAKANLAAARANLSKARAAAREARLQYERDRGLSRQKVVAPAEVETRLANAQAAEAQVVASQAAVEQAKAALTRAKTNLAYTTIISPIDGVVIARSVDVGQTVAASLQAPTLFTIAEDLRKMEVHTSVAESDVGQLKVGMPVRFSVDAFSDRSFAGEVKQVRFEAQTVENVVTYDAVVSVDNEQLALRPGMTANASFVVAQRKGVLRVPVAALRFRPPEGAAAAPAGPPPKGDRRRAKKPPRKGAAAGRSGGPRKSQRQVWVLRDGKPAPLRIRTGISDGDRAELRDGALREGDRVIVGLDEGRDADKRGGRRRRPRLF